ncbi:MAG: cyclic nucleotide-binding domain-containing protein [Deltaproteobacteria bacterium]|nr:cyclic nucleotide-binding domain-containing protein [Deltaproteobacteria bacterium]
METHAPVLAAHPFLQDLDPRHLKIIGECASRVNFNAGEFLCREQDEATKFFLINHGQVAVEIYRHRRGPVTIQTLGEGEALGWLWFEKPYHWHFDARAGQLTRALALDVKCLKQKCEQDHELGYALMKRYAHLLAVQFRVTILQLVDMYGK